MEDEYISDMAESKLELESGELNLLKNIFISIFWMPLLFSEQKTRIQRRFFLFILTFMVFCKFQPAFTFAISTDLTSFKRKVKKNFPGRHYIVFSFKGNPVSFFSLTNMVFFILM